MKTRIYTLIAAFTLLASLFAVSPVADAQDYPGPFGDSPVAALVDCSDAFWAVACADMPSPLIPTEETVCESADPVATYVYNVQDNVWEIERLCTAFYTYPISY